MNLKQNPRTLLPKFFGLYCYSCNAKNVRIIVMNNLLPSGLKMHHKFDLKGTITYALCKNSRTVLLEKTFFPSQKTKYICQVTEFKIAYCNLMENSMKLRNCNFLKNYRYFEIIRYFFCQLIMCISRFIHLSAT